MTADASKMYSAVFLSPEQHDLHHFIWRKSPTESLQDCRMTWLTFDVLSLSFIANMAIKQNAVDLAHKYPLAAETVHKEFYVDDGLVGANFIEEANQLQYVNCKSFSYVAAIHSTSRRVVIQKLWGMFFPIFLILFLVYLFQTQTTSLKS